MQQSDFAEIMISYTLSTICSCILILAAIRDKGLLFPLLALAIITRLILVFGIPCLSDDIYRFFWDGLLMHDGIHPLSSMPKDIMMDSNLGGIEYNTLFPLLNSQEYFTIYPPISQLVFYIATIPEMFSIYKSTIIMKSILLITEIGMIYYLYQLLSKLNMHKSNLLIYALNPLVIVEIMGNVHFEGMMVLFLLMGIIFIIDNRMILAGLAFILSVATKLLPLMFIPLILLYLIREGRRYLKFLMAFVIFCAIFFIPFFMGIDIPHFVESLDLYFRKFEFNASIYYLSRYIGQVITGYNQISIIGPFLSLLSLGLILIISWKNYKRDEGVGELLVSMFFIFITYLLLATTVHPWYLILPIALTVFYRRIWIIVWSLLIIISYSTYADPDYNQNLYLISIEYFIVGIIWYIETKTRIKIN